MLYICLIGYDPTLPPDPTEPKTLQPQHQAYERELREKGVYVSGAALMPPEFVPAVRIRNGATTDGPFAETKEMLGGYYLLECKDIAEAATYAASIPNSKHGWIDVRQLALYHADAERVAKVAVAP